MHRHELTDEEWALIAHLFPDNKRKGEPWKDHRTVLNGMFWRMRTGAPWRDIPERYGPWQTIYDRFNRYRKNGQLERILQELQIRLDAEGLIDWDLWCVDGSSIRASRAAAGAGKRGDRKNRPTTLWVAHEADSAAKSTWLLTATACPSRSRSRRGKSTSPRNSRK
jgi:transposase